MLGSACMSTCTRMRRAYSALRFTPSRKARPIAGVGRPQLSRPLAHHGAQAPAAAPPGGSPRLPDRGRCALRRQWPAYAARRAAAACGGFAGIRPPAHRAARRSEHRHPEPFRGVRVTAAPRCRCPQPQHAGIATSDVPARCPASLRLVSTHSPTLAFAVEPLEAARSHVLVGQRGSSFYSSGCCSR